MIVRILLLVSVETYLDKLGSTWYTSGRYNSITLYFRVQCVRILQNLLATLY